MRVLASDPVLDAAAGARADAEVQDERSRRSARRALVAAVKQCPLLLAVRNGMPALFPALTPTLKLADPKALVALAFTDDEAIHAWKTERHPAMPEVEIEPSTSLAGGNVPGRSEWLKWLPDTRGPKSGFSPAVIINPAGPLGCFVARSDLWLRQIGRSPQAPEGAGAEWRDLAHRLRERDRARALVDELERSVGAGDHDAFVVVSGEAVNRMGDPLLVARLELIRGRLLHARGEASSSLVKMAEASGISGYFGDPYRSIDVLLEAQPWIAEAELSEKDTKTARKLIESRLRAFEVPYRADEVAAVLGRDWPPRHRLPLRPRLKKARWDGEPAEAHR